MSPSPAVIAATRVGEPVQQTITLANVGGAATTITGVTVDGAGLTLVSGPAAGTVLNASETSAVLVAFDAIAPGPASGTLNVTTTDGLRTTPITATATVAALSLSPDGVVDFGPVCVGQLATRSFTARGVGDGDLLLSAISDPGAPFAVVATGLPATVLAAGGNEVTFAVTAAPIAEGLRTSTLAVATDIPGGAPRVIEVNVMGLAGGVNATPLELDLGSHALDVTTSGQVLMLTNCGVDPIDFTNARIEGVDSQSFTLVAQPTSTTIAASSSASWLVVFHATSVGNKTADFAVDHNGQTSRIVLFGEGLTDEVAGIAPGDPRSYYSCSAGGVSALWPMVLAFAVVTRRRRRVA
ncbi:MAG: choice-of-anchor D domain-containing protein [Proteobacteria bacterium]|nr:choice-of-anchor D domain-containing protein [Pseudomonadota bacterium]